MDYRKAAAMSEQARVGDTAEARRAARISAAQALVKANRLVGKVSDPAIVALANARSRKGEFLSGTEEGRRVAN